MRCDIGRLKKSQCDGSVNTLRGIPRCALSGITHFFCLALLNARCCRMEWDWESDVCGWWGTDRSRRAGVDGAVAAVDRTVVPTRRLTAQRTACADVGSA